MRTRTLLTALGLASTIAMADPEEVKATPSVTIETDAVVELQPNSAQIVQKAKSIRAEIGKNHASQPQAKGFVSDLRQMSLRGWLAVEDEALARAFVADEAKPVAERFEVSALLAFNKVDRSKPVREQALERLGTMRKLLKDSPHEPMAARYLLLAARGAPGQEAIEAASKVLETESAEPDVRADAALLIVQRQLLARPIPDLELPAECAGRFSLFYAWSKNNPEALNAARALPEIEGTLRVGLNIDTDSESATEHASDMQLPEPQCYAGLSYNSLATLQILPAATWYLIDERGLVREIGSYERVLRRLESILSQRQGRIDAVVSQPAPSGSHPFQQ